MRIFILAATAGLLAACASQGGYQARSANDPYGYAEMQVEPGRMLISYRGDTSTPRETVEMYLLYRAAETTLEHGHDYFVAAGHDVDAQTRLEQTTFRPRFGSTYRTISNHNAAIDIVMRDGERPKNLANAYEARAVREALGPRVTAAQRQ
ncbi:MAG: hypothetical protein GC189_12265 [Alphaproteobacteria bacterium]|nr:hypothetical protein [Alphaproteobacteria bacterium]